MGSADVVPGVSGGTIAFITNIYEELLDSIKSFDTHAFRLLIKGDIRNLWIHVNGSFLVVLLSGIAASILTLAGLIHYLLDHHPIELWSFFFGLIVISSLTVIKKIKIWNLSAIIAGLIGILLGYLITDLSPASTPENYLFIFFSGALAICAMILPGISGSFILLILGKYEFIIASIKDLNLLVLTVFALGCVVGLLSFSRLVSWLLHHYHDLTVALLAGFMLGSLNKIWPWKETLSTRTNSKGEIVPYIQENILPTDYLDKTGGDPMVLHALFYAAVGILLVIAIEKMAAYGKKQ
jgi:putative membrane protein